jgi:hypothetical protein
LVVVLELKKVENIKRQADVLVFASLFFWNESNIEKDSSEAVVFNVSLTNKMKYEKTLFE